ncbi:MAG TPA: flagellar hook-basal body complex protein FliE [Bryobacteraceae bacterium]|nr:flagellar hook-basal body complex protein FliE [Bryobacteraceae bacterium]
MPAPIAPISAPVLAEPVSLTAQPSSGGSFQEAFATAVQSVESFDQNANASVGRLLSGEGEELHTTALAVQQAELSFDLFMQMRNKVVSAYQEVMRMQM